MTPAKTEILQEQHAKGLKADLMLRAFGDLHDTREKQIIDDLIAWFVTQDWDERTAIRYIAKLSENRAQRDELLLRSRKGTEARNALFGGTNTTAD